MHLYYDTCNKKVDISGSLVPTMITGHMSKSTKCVMGIAHLWLYKNLS